VSEKAAAWHAGVGTIEVGPEQSFRLRPVVRMQHCWRPTQNARRIR